MNASASNHCLADADILATALISDEPEIMGVDQLSPEMQEHIFAGRLRGNHLVSVRWLTGQFSLMFCEPGCRWPDPNKVIAAYRQCIHTAQTFPEGTQS